MTNVRKTKKAYVHDRLVIRGYNSCVTELKTVKERGEEVFEPKEEERETRHSKKPKVTTEGKRKTKITVQY